MSSEDMKIWNLGPAICRARHHYCLLYGYRHRLHLNQIASHSTLRHRSLSHAIHEISPGRCMARNFQHARLFSIEAIPTALLPPVAFVGLFITLWVYKSMMMVLLQDKIIYMPYVPPFSRSEKIEDYTVRCRPVQWTTQYIRSLDGTKIALCTGNIRQMKEPASKHIVICYFQGNGSSLPPRLPMLSSVYKLIYAQQDALQTNIDYTLIALSYRGYWKSSGRASQSGIELDAQAVLDWIAEEYSHFDGLEIILWGQSIGAGIVSTATAAYQSRNSKKSGLKILAMILETPFCSIRSMLTAMYPQKWLPYGYLWPFLWNHWDSVAALRRMSGNEKRPKILLLAATKDEIVPAVEADKLEKLCEELGLDVQREDIAGALHTEAMTKPAGREAVARFMVNAANHDGKDNSRVA